MVGHQKYRPNAPRTKSNDEKGRYITYKDDTTVSVWGMESFYWQPDVLLITEGIWDCVKLHNLGLPAIAVLANDPKRIRSWFKLLHRRVIAVCDDDKAGAKLKNSADDFIVVKGGKDLGDLTSNEVIQLLEPLGLYLEYDEEVGRV